MLCTVDPHRRYLHPRRIYNDRNQMLATTTHRRAIPLRKVPTAAASSDYEDLWWAGWQLEIARFTEKALSRNSAEDKRAIDEDARAAAHAVDVARLKSQISELAARLKASQAQRACLEAVISERLESELHATTQADSMRAALRIVTGRVSDLSMERDRDRAAATELATVAAQRASQLHDVEVQLAEVESFLGGTAGAHTARLEAELAEARLRLAEAESDKDDLEQELAECRAAAQEAHEYGRILAATQVEAAKATIEALPVARGSTALGPWHGGAWQAGSGVEAASNQGSVPHKCPVAALRLTEKENIRITASW